MTWRALLPLLSLSLLLAFGSTASAKDEVVAAPANAGQAAKSKGGKDAGKEAAVAAPVSLEAAVRGLFVETRVGGGYMAVNDKAVPDQYNRSVSGNEQLGAGMLVQFGIGYEINGTFGLQAMAGLTTAASRGGNKVRDLSLGYGGAAVRFAASIGERVDFTVALGGGFGRADSGVTQPAVTVTVTDAASGATRDVTFAAERPQDGPLALANFGIEYFVHVRHFAVGIDLSVMAPVAPLRVFVGLAPHIKYTF